MTSEAKPLCSLQIGMRWAGLDGSGGLDRVFYQLVNGLPTVGITTLGIVQGPENVAQLTGGLAVPFAVDNASLGSRLRGARNTVLREMDKQSFDVIASHFSLYAAPSVVAIRRRSKFVVHFHGPWSGESREENGSCLANILKKRIEQFVYLRADRIIVLSHAFAKLIVERYKVDSERVTVIPGGVDLTRFAHLIDSDTSRRKLGLPSDRPILLTVRRLSARMGLGDLIDAVAMIAIKVPDILLLIAGSGVLKSDLEAKISSLGLQKNVRMLGFFADADLPDLYCSADLHVVPTLALEGFGLVVVEALAAGTASVVTRVGGLPEIVDAVSPDLVVSPGRPEELADLVASILSGRVAAPSPSICRTYAQTFSTTISIEKTAQIYRALT